MTISGGVRKSKGGRVLVSAIAGRMDGMGQDPEWDWVD